MTNTKQDALAKLIALANHQNARTLIMRLIHPIGRLAIQDLIASEVAELTGGHYDRRDSGLVRWGYNKASLWLGEKKITLKMPRLRDKTTGNEVKLKSLAACRKKIQVADSDLMAVLKLLSRFEYDTAVNKILNTFDVDSQKLPPNFFATANQILSPAFENPTTHKPAAFILDGMGLHAQGFAVISLAANGTSHIRFHLSARELNQDGLRKFSQEIRQRQLATARELPIFIKSHE